MPKALTVHARAEETRSFTFRFYFVPQRLPPVLVLASTARVPVSAVPGLQSPDPLRLRRRQGIAFLITIAIGIHLIFAAVRWP